MTSLPSIGTMNHNRVIYTLIFRRDELWAKFFFLSIRVFLHHMMRGKARFFLRSWHPNYLVTLANFPDLILWRKLWFYFHYFLEGIITDWSIFLMARLRMVLILKGKSFNKIITSFWQFLFTLISFESAVLLVSSWLGELFSCSQLRENVLLSTQLSSCLEDWIWPSRSCGEVWRLGNLWGRRLYWILFDLCIQFKLGCEQ